MDRSRPDPRLVDRDQRLRLESSHRAGSDPAPRQGTRESADSEVSGGYPADSSHFGRAGAREFHADKASEGTTRALEWTHYSSTSWSRSTDRNRPFKPCKWHCAFIELCPACQLTVLYVVDKLVLNELVRFSKRDEKEVEAELEEQGAAIWNLPVKTPATRRGGAVPDAQRRSVRRGYRRGQRPARRLDHHGTHREARNQPRADRFCDATGSRLRSLPGIGDEIRILRSQKQRLGEAPAIWESPRDSMGRGRDR